MDKRIRQLTLGICTILVVLLALNGCKEEKLVYLTSNNVNITTYLEKNPERFSEFLKILEISKTDGFLQAYGRYTFFLPTNDAVKEYLSLKGKTTIDQISPEEWRSIVTLHLLNDTISTRKLTDGKINPITMYGQYLTAGTVMQNGVSSIVINRQAKILKPNNIVGNGIIHEVDHVLEPAKATLAQLIEGNPKYSIFAEALNATGLMDTLRFLPAENPVAARKWMTVIVETDSVLKEAGYPDFNTLKARLSKGGDPKSVKDSLHLFMAYHLIYDIKFLADIASYESHGTAATADPFYARLDGQKVLINDIVFDDVYEPGVSLIRSRSDVAALNGVLHETAPYAWRYESKTGVQTGVTNGHYAIKVRQPKAVYWEPTDFPEVKNNPNVYGKKTSDPFLKATLATTPIAGWDWPNAGTNTKFGMVYRYDATRSFVNNDCLNPALGVWTAANSGSATNAWVQMRSPILVKGKYKVWFCYERREQTGQWPTGRRVQCQVTIGKQVMLYPFDFAEPPPTVSTMKELESLGWKYYTSNPVLVTYSSGGKPSNVFVGKYVGIVDIPSTDRYPIRLDVLQGNQNSSYLDMVHFIPVDAPSQILPRFGKDGSKDFTDIP